MSQRPSIALVMIVKNESENISNAINSLISVVDQIVIVDTGSEDQTPKIATRLGAELYFFNWNGNFADARNFALMHVRTDWVISLDSDEVFDTGDILSLNHIMSDAKYGGINVRILNSLGEEDNSPLSEHRYTRIFRRNKEIRYAGRIHEQIRPSIEKLGYDIYESDLAIYHYGYMHPTQDKKQRNRDLLLEEIQANPNDNWLKYHLAATEFALNNYQEAKRLFISIVASKELSADQSDFSKIRLAQIALADDDLSSLFHWLDFKSENVNLEGLRNYVLAAGYSSQKKFQKALDCYLSDATVKSSLVDKTQLEIFVTALREVVKLSR